MAAKQSGGVGAFGWTLLGFLAGVAATLAVQVILVGRDRDDDQDEAPRAAPVVAVTPHLPAPKPKVKPAPAAAPAAAKAVTSEDQQVAEDAAAAGVTSRAAPSADATKADAPR